MCLTDSLKTGDVANCDSSLKFVHTYTLEIALRLTETSGGQSKFTHNSYSYLVYTTVTFTTHSCDIFIQVSIYIIFVLFKESIVT